MVVAVMVYGHHGIGLLLLLLILIICGKKIIEILLSPNSHIIQQPASALETLGSINTIGISFLSELSCKLTSVSGDP